MVTWPVLPPDLDQPVIDALPYGVLACKALWGEEGEIVDFTLYRFNEVAQRELPALADWVAGVTLKQLFPLDAQGGLFDTYTLVYQSRVSSRNVYRSPTTGQWYQSVIAPWQDGVVAMGVQLGLPERILVLVDDDRLAAQQLQQVLVHHQLPMRVECYTNAEQFWHRMSQNRLCPDLLLVNLQLPDPGYSGLLADWQRRERVLAAPCPVVVWGRAVSLADKRRCYQAGAVLTLNKDAYSIEILLELALGANNPPESIQP